MSSYDTFANFYDRTMGDRGDEIKLIQAQINHYRRDAKTLLELGCGTGSILLGLASDYTVSGIERSAEMLKLAQQKLPASDLSLGDISNFSLNKYFDVVICVFDTINHLNDLASWQSLFNHTHHHLSPHGLFVFDMNTTGRLKALSSLSGYVQTIGQTTVEMAVTPAGPNAVDWHITVQDPGPDGTIQVHEDHARERSYPLSQVESALTKANFEIIRSFDSFDRPPNNDSDRVYFVCRALPIAT